MATIATNDFLLLTSVGLALRCTLVKINSALVLYSSSTVKPPRPGNLLTGTGPKGGKRLSNSNAIYFRRKRGVHIESASKRKGQVEEERHCSIQRLSVFVAKPTEIEWRVQVTN